ncbi:Uma2 family endonuclease [Actinoplanes derwentensis]|nr:Uma2 family endonuclease [Actinoplanes derwentensis]
MSAEPVGEWQWPPTDRYTADDLDRIPGLPAHTELIDGLLAVVSPQKHFHMKCLRVLENALDRSAPWDRFRVSREMSIVLGPRQRPEPDLIVVHAEAEVDSQATWYPAEAVVLAVEVVSPESEIRDRDRKPQLYAEAGIPHFWRVEDAGDKAVLYAYELDPTTRRYFPVGIFHDRVALTVPFDVEIDLTEVHRR